MESKYDHVSRSFHESNSFEESEKLWNSDNKNQYRNSYSFSQYERLINSKRLCLKAPNGRLIYAHKTGEIDSWIEHVSNRNENRNNNNALNDYFRAIDYLEDNIDFPPEQTNNHALLDSYIYHRWTFVICLLSIASVNICCSLVGFTNKDDVLANIIAINGSDKAPKFFYIFLQVSLTIDVVVHSMVLFTGLLCFITNKSKIFHYHSFICVTAFFTSILLWYIHQLFLVAFLLRTLFYIYVRYVISLLNTILLMPSNTF